MYTYPVIWKDVERQYNLGHICTLHLSKPHTIYLKIHTFPLLCVIIKLLLLPHYHPSRSKRPFHSLLDIS